MKRAAFPRILLIPIALAAAGFVPAAAAEELTPSVATADSRGPAVTFLAPNEKTGKTLPPGAGSHSSDELRQRWEAMTPKQRIAVLETLKTYIGEYWQNHPPGQVVPGPLSGNNGGGGGEDPPAPGMTVTATALPATGAAPLSVTLRAEANDPDGPVFQYFWDFGDGQSTGGQFASHTYSTPGIYWATVMAFGPGSNSGYAQALIQVSAGGGSGGGGGDPNNQPPQVVLTASPDEGEQPLIVAASASASDPDGWIASYAWDFGDGAGSTSPSASHTYLAEGTYTARVTVTDNKGAAASAAAIIEVGSNVDSDGDGLPDKTERRLANQFMPSYFLSIFELPGTGMAKFEDRPDEQRVSQVFSSLPPTAHIYHRVTPLGVTGGKSYVQIDYLSLWNRDDGLVVGNACLSDLDVLDFFGIWSPQFGTGLRGHALDNERTVFRLVAPASSGGLNTKPGAYRVDQVIAAAHEDTPFEHSQLYRINPPAGPEVHFALYLSLSKHATYGFWPHGLPLLPPQYIGAIYGGVALACIFVSPDICDLLWFIADEVIFDCMTEKHVPGLGGVEPSASHRVNVGEANNPLPGSSFILVPDLQHKLDFLIPFP